MMNTTRRFGGLLAVLALGLVAACSSTDETTAPTEAASSSPSIDCMTATDEEWEEHCQDAPPGEGEPSEGQAGGAPIPLGESFEYESMMADGPGASWSVTLSEVECGLEAAPEADSNPEWDGGDDTPEYVDAVPEEGMEFCILTWDWENVGKTPGTPDQSGDLMLGDEQHARSSEDEMRSWTMMETQLEVGYTDEVNPGETTKSLDLYQVPEGVTPDAVWFPMETVISPPWILVATK